jgi:predicted peptidase
MAGTKQGHDVKGVTAITEVFPYGQQIAKLVVEHSSEIKASSLGVANYEVDDRTSPMKIARRFEA